jgi:hypothetical protein
MFVNCVCQLHALATILLLSVFTSPKVDQTSDIFSIFGGLCAGVHVVRSGVRGVNRCNLLLLAVAVIN